MYIPSAYSQVRSLLTKTYINMLVHGRVVFEYLFDDFRIHATVEESFVSLICLQSAGPFGLLLLIAATS
jgi:hypothetical protein